MGFGFEKLKILDLSNISFANGEAVLQSIELFPSLNYLDMSSNNFSGIVVDNTPTSNTYSLTCLKSFDIIYGNNNGVFG